MIDPTTGMEVGAPAQPAQPTAAPLDPAQQAQRQKLAQALMAMGKPAPGANPAGQMIGNQFVPTSPLGDVSGVLAQFAPALQQFMKRPAPGATAGAAPGLVGGD